MLSLPPEPWRRVVRRVVEGPSTVAWAWAAVRAPGEKWRVAALACRRGPVAPIFLRYQAVAIAVDAIPAGTAGRRLSAGRVAPARAIG